MPKFPPPKTTPLVRIPNGPSHWSVPLKNRSIVSVSRLQELGHYDQPRGLGIGPRAWDLGTGMMGEWLGVVSRQALRPQGTTSPNYPPGYTPGTPDGHIRWVWGIGWGGIVGEAYTPIAHIPHYHLHPTYTSQGPIAPWKHPVGRRLVGCGQGGSGSWDGVPLVLHHCCSDPRLLPTVPSNPWTPRAKGLRWEGV